MSKAELLQGTLEMLILRTLQGGPLHGYAVAQRIERLSADVLRVEEGSLYPALYRMEDRGWIVSKYGLSEHNRRARYYRLTSGGRRQLDTAAETWHRLSGAVSRVMQGA